MRVLRVSLGFMAVVAGVVYRDPLVATLGGVTLLQGVFNLSCCGVHGCSIPRTKSGEETAPDTAYEIIKK